MWNLNSEQSAGQREAGRAQARVAGPLNGLRTLVWAFTLSSSLGRSDSHISEHIALEQKLGEVEAFATACCSWDISSGQPNNTWC